MKIQPFVTGQYQKFSLAEGSEYIVSEYALEKILEIINEFKARNILEIGLGIGTISGSILEFARKNNIILKCAGTESDIFCLDQMAKNLGANYEKLEIYANISELPTGKLFDLIIVDGKEYLLDKIPDKIASRGIIVVEGDRKEQVKKIRSLFPSHKFASMVSVRKNNVYSKKSQSEFKGGLKLIFVNPDYRQYIYWLKVKLWMKFKYFKRDYLS